MDNLNIFSYCLKGKVHYELGRQTLRLHFETACDMIRIKPAMLTICLLTSYPIVEFANKRIGGQNHLFRLLTAQQMLQINSIMEDIECVFESMTGKGSIYISNLPAAQNLSLLQTLRIKAILSVARCGLVHHRKDEIPHYLYIPAEDHEQYQLLPHFNQTYEFIEQARRETNVLVHCMVGVSRSVTIVIAYLLKKYKYSLSQVISIIQRKRRKINPNRGFIEQLRKYAQQEGIPCNFDAQEVPNIKEKSPYKSRKMAVNDKKEEGVALPSKDQRLGESLPIPKKKSGEGSCDIRGYGKMSDQLVRKKEIVQQVKMVSTISSQFADKTTETQPSPPKKATSPKKSIVEKINQVREKLLRKQELKRQQSRGSMMRSTSFHEQKARKKQNKKGGEPYQAIDEANSRKVNSYLQLYSKNHVIEGISSRKEDFMLHLKRSSQPIDLEEYSCHTQEHPGQKIRRDFVSFQSQTLKPKKTLPVHPAFAQ